MSAAAIPAAFRPWACVAPTATAAAFFATPASSTPTGSSETSHTTPARWNASATPWASASERDAHTSPAPVSTISRACAGPPTQATRSLPNAASSATVGGVPSGRHEALRQRHDPGARPTRPSRPSSAMRLGDALRGHREEDEVGAAELVAVGAERVHPQVARQLDAREVALVAARRAELRRLLGGAAQQRGAQPGALEQHRHGGAERAGARRR